jgi:hypothetical protein
MIADSGSSSTTGQGVGSVGNSLVLRTNSTVRATLDSSGNLGLGVTPSAWGSSFKTLEMPGGIALSAFGTSPSDLILSANMYYDTGYKYKQNGYSTQYEQYNGTHRWYNAASGTAGNAITFTQAMTLDASGRLGIGTTSPTVRLDVNGSINVTGDSLLNGTWSGLTTRYRSGDDGGTAYLQSVALSSGTVTGGKALALDGDILRFRTISGAAFTERFRIGSAGQLGIGGANYGTSGQVLTSQGSGSAPVWGSVPSPAIKQVVSTTKKDSFQTTADGWIDVTGLSLSITITSGKIYGVFSLLLDASSGNGVAGIRILRNNVAEGNAVGINGVTAAWNTFGTGSDAQQFTPTFLDTGLSSGTYTYKVQVNRNNCSSVSCNRFSNNDSFVGTNIAQSSVTLMEVV